MGSNIRQYLGVAMRLITEVKAVDEALGDKPRTFENIAPVVLADPELAKMFGVKIDSDLARGLSLIAQIVQAAEGRPQTMATLVDILYGDDPAYAELQALFAELTGAPE